ncbi:MAG: hypothetical protein ACRCZ9_12150 [Fusobacteriaceae bacterium]
MEIMESVERIKYAVDNIFNTNIEVINGLCENEALLIHLGYVAGGDDHEGFHMLLEQATFASLAIRKEMKAIYMTPVFSKSETLEDNAMVGYIKAPLVVVDRADDLELLLDILENGRYNLICVTHEGYRTVEKMEEMLDDCNEDM